MLKEPSGGRLMENDSSANDVNLSAAAYLLSRVGSVLGNDSVDLAISKVSQATHRYNGCTLNSMVLQCY